MQKSVIRIGRIERPRNLGQIALAFYAEHGDPAWHGLRYVEESARGICRHLISIQTAGACREITARVQATIGGDEKDRDRVLDRVRNE